eukprot:gene2941-7604_t
MAEEPAKKKSRKDYLSEQLEGMLGSETIAARRASFADLEERKQAEPKKKQYYDAQQDGMIRETMSDGQLSIECVRLLYGAGYTRVKRIRDGLKEVPAAQAARGRGRSGENITKETEARTKTFCRDIPLDQGFAPGCTHRKAHVYFEDGKSYR